MASVKLAVVNLVAVEEEVVVEDVARVELEEEVVVTSKLRLVEISVPRLTSLISPMKLGPRPAAAMHLSFVVFFVSK